MKQLGLLEEKIGSGMQLDEVDLSAEMEFNFLNIIKFNERFDLLALDALRL